METVKKYRYWILLAVIILLISGYFVWRRDYGTPDPRGMESVQDGLDRSAERLESAADETRRAESELDGAAADSNDIADTSRQLAERTNKSQAELADCQRILDRSKERAARDEELFRKIEERNRGSSTPDSHS
ncbi:hypothetical protein [uncultured Dialister sp.]|uniref:hypothetical protein n=1 Tax=uncultured Dialister sp. TaxID=278064 RepID=UPI00258F4B98|nr:hypothetical protein [uncultured Dialister sp.]